MTDKRYMDYIDEATFEWTGETLEHHGVKGQKHGVRQYQNEDGSLTDLGREHYGVGAPRAKDAVAAYFAKKAKEKKQRDIIKAKKKKAKEQALAEKKERQRKEKERKSGKGPTEKYEGRDKVSDHKNFRELKRDMHYMTNQELQDEVKRLTTLASVSSKAAEEASHWKGEKYVNAMIKTMKTVNDVYDQIDKPLGRTMLKEFFDVELPKDPGHKGDDKKKGNKDKK